MPHVAVGDESFTGADLDAVRHDEWRHFPLHVLPAQHSQLWNRWRSQEPGVVWRRRTTTVQPCRAEASDAAQHAVLGLRSGRVSSARRVLRQRCRAEQHWQSCRAQYCCHCSAVLTGSEPLLSWRTVIFGRVIKQGLLSLNAQRAACETWNAHPLYWGLMPLCPNFTGMGPCPAKVLISFDR